MNNSEQSLAQLEQELKNAQQVFDRAKEEERAANASMTAAMNTLNNVQKKLDAYIAQLKKSAPWNTEWHSSQRTSAKRPSTDMLSEVNN